MIDPQTATGFGDLLPDESLAKLATGYGVQRSMIAQMTQQHAAEIERLKAEHALAVKGLEARIEAKEAELSAALADLDHMRSSRVTVATGGVDVTGSSTFNVAEA